MATPKNYKVFADGKPKGEVFYAPKAKRWRWFTTGRGTETFPPHSKLPHIKAAIAALCRAEVVELRA